MLGTEGGPPLRGWACTEDAQLRATLATVKSAVLVLLGLRPCFWEQGLQGHWSCGAQSPGPDCGLGGGVFLQSPASPSSQAVPGWKLPVGSTAQAPQHPSWTLGHEDTLDPQRSVPTPTNSTRKGKKESREENKGTKHLSTTQIRQGKAKNNFNIN